MRTDIHKINEQTPHQELTEGLMMFAGELLNILIPVNGEQEHRFSTKICAGIVWFVLWSVLIPVYR